MLVRSRSGRLFEVWAVLYTCTCAFHYEDIRMVVRSGGGQACALVATGLESLF